MGRFGGLLPPPHELWGFGVQVKFGGAGGWGPSSAGQEGFGVPFWGTGFGGVFPQIMSFLGSPTSEMGRFGGVSFTPN